MYAEHIRPAGWLPIQPGVHGLARSAHQRTDLSACWRRSHQHAVSAQLRLVRCGARYISRSTKSVRCWKHFVSRKRLKVTFLSPVLGIQSRISVCGSWVTSQKSLKMKVDPLFLLCLQLVLNPTCMCAVRKRAGSVAGKWVYLFVFDPRRRVPEGQVWAVKWPVEPLHSGSAVHEWGEHPVGSGHGAAGGWIQTFSQQEEICHRYVVRLIIPTHLILVFLMHRQLKLHVLCFSLGRYMADCWGDPPQKKVSLHTKVGNSARLPEPLDPSEHSRASVREARISLQ